MLVAERPKNIYFLLQQRNTRPRCQQGCGKLKMGIFSRKHWTTSATDLTTSSTCAWSFRVSTGVDIFLVFCCCCLFVLCCLVCLLLLFSSGNFENWLLFARSHICRASQQVASLVDLCLDLQRLSDRASSVYYSEAQNKNIPTLPVLFPPPKLCSDFIKLSENSKLQQLQRVHSDRSVFYRNVSTMLFFLPPPPPFCPTQSQI